MRRTGAVCCCLLAALAVMQGCATSPGKAGATVIDDPKSRIRFQGFTILPPQGMGWAIEGKNPLFARITKRMGEVLATAGVTAARAAAPVRTHEALAEHLRQRGRDDAATDPGFSPPEFEWSPRISTGPPCISFRFTFSLGTRGKEREIESRVSGVSCVHPDSDVMVVSLGAGQTLPVGAPPADLDPEFGPYLESLAFEPLRKPFVSGFVNAGKGLNCLAAGHGDLWAADTFGGAVVRISPTSGNVRARIGGLRGPVGIAITDDAVWCTLQHANVLVRIDPGSNRETLRVKVGKGPLGIAWGEGALWVANNAGGSVSRVDPGSGRMLAEIPVGEGPTGVAVAGGQVWVSNFDDGRIVRIDPATNAVVGEGIQTGCGPVLPGSDGAAVWFPLSGCEGADAVLKVDVSGAAPPERYPAGFEGPVSAKVSEGLILVTSAREGSLQRLDARTGALIGEAMAVAPGAFDVVVAAGSVWVSGKSTGRIYRIELE